MSRSVSIRRSKPIFHIPPISESNNMFKIFEENISAKKSSYYSPNPFKNQKLQTLEMLTNKEFKKRIENEDVSPFY
jgi:hypothetical protein